MGDPETQEISISSAKRRGNWITFPFIIGAVTCLTIAGAGWILNLLVYLIVEFNVKSIDAAQISNIVNGAYSLFPIVGAIIADSFLGSFLVVAVSSVISFVGIVFLAITATVDSLRPKPCGVDAILCESPSKFQYAVLYGSLTLAAIGIGGSRFTMATLGANQFQKEEDRSSFFNWYFVALNFSSVISATAIIYIENNVSWSLGFWICALMTLVGIVILLVGNHFYRHDMPQGSPYTSLARVVIAAIRKKTPLLSPTTQDYCFERDSNGKEASTSITKRFRFFNRAAIKAEGETKPDGSIVRPWKLCTVQQVEDFKTLIKVLPVCSTGIFLSTPMTIQISFTVLQSLTMDRRLGNHFKIPPASITVIVLLSISIFLSLNDRFFFPFWKKVTRKSPTLFQRIGIGHMFSVLSLGISALVEMKRLKIAHAQHTAGDQNNSGIVPMAVFWLFPQLILAGIAEAFHFPGQVSLYYQEFPDSLRSTATAMISLILGVSYYLGTALTDLIRRVTNWLPDNIDNGRVDNVYWVLTVITVLNFGYFLCFAIFYKYKNAQKTVGETSSGSASES